MERRGRVRASQRDPEVRRDEDRVPPDDGAVKWFRLCGRFAALAMPTAGESRGKRQDEGPRRRGWIGLPSPHHGFSTCIALTAAVARFSTPSLV